MHRFRMVLATTGVVAAFAAGAAAAQARDILVPNYQSQSVSIVNSATGLVIHTVPLTGGPWFAVVSPNGKTAYIVTYDTYAAVPLNLHTFALGTPQSLGSKSTVGYLNQVAITPNGGWLFAASGKGVVRLNLHSGASKFIPTTSLYGVAITPNGKTVYLTANSSNAVIPLSTGTAVLGTPIPIPKPTFGALTPDGSTLWVQSSNGDVYPVRTATGSVGTPIATLGTSDPYGLAITPNGRMAWALDYNQQKLYPITLASRTVGGAITVGAEPEYPVISPDGKTVYTANYSDDTLSPVSTSTLTVGTPIKVGTGPGQVGIVPDQPAKAAFSFKVKGSKVHFNAKHSHDPDGKVVLYEWNFGGGKTVRTKKAKISHRFKHKGTHKVTLTVVDNAGCSTKQIYTGQELSCNGSKIARKTHRVKIRT